MLFSHQLLFFLHASCPGTLFYYLSVGNVSFACFRIRKLETSARVTVELKRGITSKEFFYGKDTQFCCWTMVLILYMMEISPPCRAVLMTIKYLGIQAELREENITIGNSKQHSEFLKINPRSCVPTIDDDGFYLWESRAIMTYLVNKHAPSNTIYPKDPKKRALVDMMLSFDQGTLYRAQVEYLYPMIFRGEPPDPVRESSYRSSLICLEHTLEKNAYVAGKHLTLADFSIVANISLAEAYNYNFKHFPNLVAWLRRLKNELPYFREINEVPLLQFKFWYRPYQDLLEDEETEAVEEPNVTRM